MSFDRPVDPAIPVSPWVERFAGLVPEGQSVLDVACGHGRHVRFFRARGHRVVAVDVDVSGLEDLTGDAGVEIVQADLEREPWPFEGRDFGGVVVTNYLHRPLLPLLIAAVAPGGVLIYETFSRGNELVGPASKSGFPARSRRAAPGAGAPACRWSPTSRAGSGLRVLRCASASSSSTLQSRPSCLRTTGPASSVGALTLSRPRLAAVPRRGRLRFGGVA